ncbi:hypothetical protein LINPERHAP2_LOCUS25315 [Linum perenne]
MEQKELISRQRRKVELLKDYDCTIEYHPEKANVVTDALSRKGKSSELGLLRKLRLSFQLRKEEG